MIRVFVWPWDFSKLKPPRIADDTDFFRSLAEYEPQKIRILKNMLKKNIKWLRIWKLMIKNQN